MPALAYSFVPLTVGVEGKLVWIRPRTDRTNMAAAEVHDIPFPAGTHAVNRRPSWATYNILGKSRTYGVGAWTANIVIDENMRFLRQGIPAPNVRPGLQATGSGGLEGIHIGYFRFLDSRANRVGPLSHASDELEMTGESRLWSAVPTSCLDPSVDSVQGLVSVDGAEPRVAWTRQLSSATTVTEAVPTLALGEIHPDPEFVEMPYGAFNAIYHDRQAVAGLESEPESLFLSSLGFPERYEGLKFTADGKINGLFVAGGGDVLLAGTSNGGKTNGGSVWRLTGFTEGDFVWERDRDDMGFITHFGGAMVHKYAVLPTTDGVFAYVSGTWVPLLRDRRTEWLREYATWRSDYEHAEGFFDPVGNVYQFGPVRHTRLNNLDGEDAWTYWVLDCQGLFPESGGDFGAAWGNDVRDRKDTGRAVFYLPGSTKPEVVVGSEDGRLRLENREDNSDDDGDTYHRCIVEPATYRPAAPLGMDPLNGFAFEQAWSYVEAEMAEWTMEARGGSELCRQRVDSDFQDVTAASADGDAEALGRHHHVTDLVTGDAFNYGFYTDSLTGWRFRGFGVFHQALTGPGAGAVYARGADGTGIGPGQVGPRRSGPSETCGTPQWHIVNQTIEWVFFHPDPESLYRTIVGSYVINADGNFDNAGLPDFIGQQFYIVTDTYPGGGDEQIYTPETVSISTVAEGSPSVLFMVGPGGYQLQLTWDNDTETLSVVEILSGGEVTPQYEKSPVELIYE